MKDKSYYADWSAEDLLDLSDKVTEQLMEFAEKHRSEKDRRDSDGGTWKAKIGDVVLNIPMGLMITICATILIAWWMCGESGRDRIISGFSSSDRDTIKAELIAYVDQRHEEVMEQIDKKNDEIKSQIDDFRAAIMSAILNKSSAASPFASEFPPLSVPHDATIESRTQ